MKAKFRKDTIVLTDYFTEPGDFQEFKIDYIRFEGSEIYLDLTDIHTGQKYNYWKTGNFLKFNVKKGSAKNIHKRWMRHLNDLKNNKHINTYLQRAYNKYGKSDFTLEIVEYCSEESLLIREQYYLDTLKPYIDNFNIGDSATGGDNISNHPNHDEIVFKISAGLYNRYEKETDEEKSKRISSRCGNKNPNYGNKWNDAQRDKMSKQRKGVSSGRKGKTF